MAAIQNKTSTSTCPAFAAIRLRASVDRPYFSTVIFSLVPVESEKVPTLAVDQYWRLYYNPNLLNILPIEESVALLIHEVNHVIRNHNENRGDRDPMIWNMAGDMAINVDIRSDGMSLPAGTLFPDDPKFKLPVNLITEEYYDRLLKQAKKIFSGGKGRGKGAGQGNCGSCSGNKDPEWEDKSGGGSGKSKDGEDRDKHGNIIPKVDQLTQELARRKTAQDIIDHTKSRGTVPENLLRWAKEKLTSKVDWRKELRTVITNAHNYVSGMTDYTRSKLSRRQSVQKDYMMYGFHAPTPNVAVIIDTSGSMSDKDLGQATAEVGKILKFLRGKVTVLSCDAAVHLVQKIDSIGQIKLSGGGGTDMPEGFAKAAELKPLPDIVICITDGYTPWPLAPYTRFKTFAVITQRESMKDVPKWIRSLPAFDTTVEKE